MRLIIDTMGSDKGPKEIVKGAIDALNEFKNIELMLFGDSKEIEEQLASMEFDKSKIRVIHADEVITNDDDPVRAVRRKKEASMIKAAEALAEGLGDGLISAGSTGALLASGLFIVKRIDGIDRAALSVMYPTLDGFSLLVDGGANVDCKPEYLYQFALMGSIYMDKVMDVKNPSIGLVNIGTEEGKGNELTKSTYGLLKDSKLNFKGNIEGRDIPMGEVDVMVADGFAGNIALKVTEGMAISMMTMLKEQFTKNLKTKIAASMLMPELKNIKAKMDYREYGGAPLLGTKKPIVKAHGSSDAYAIKNGIKQLINFVDKDVIKIIENELKE